jgi:hypothetical protein
MTQCLNLPFQAQPGQSMAWINFVFLTNYAMSSYVILHSLTNLDNEALSVRVKE